MGQNKEAMDGSGQLLLWRLELASELFGMIFSHEETRSQ